MPSRSAADTIPYHSPDNCYTDYCQESISGSPEQFFSLQYICIFYCRLLCLFTESSAVVLPEVSVLPPSPPEILVQNTA